jgi:hypothetical protein
MAKYPAYKDLSVKIYLPNSSFLKYWNGVAAFGIIFHSIEVPLRLSFGYEIPLWLYIVDIAVLAFFGADMLVHFRMAIFKDGQLIDDPQLIKKNYVKRNFWRDFVVNFPFGYLIMFLGRALGGGALWMTVANLARLNHGYRFLRIFNLFPVRSRLLEQPMQIRIFQYASCCGIASHWVACGWIKLNGYDAAEGIATAYNKALYWTITTLTTVGYGDICPKDNFGRLYTMMVMILGVGMYGFVIGNISSLLVKVDSVRENHRRKMNSLSDFMQHCQVPPHLQDEVFEFYTHFLSVNTTGENSAILEDLPRPLKMQLEMYSNMKLINAVPMFKNLSQSCREDLAKSLVQVVVGPKENIISFGEIGMEMYFLGHGMVEVISAQEQVLATLESGSFFGETALLREVTRTANIKSLTYCNLYKLDKEPFSKILAQHKDLADTILNINNAR